ncbi:trafficking protein particle complex subunit 10 [Biscogniauxia mediterranea]|nr:trafficking protein particle complex subunit 10 [Biscogniauxia mediterranea]
MEQPFSTSKVTVECFDPHDVFKLLAPGLVPRLPLRNLHWQSHAGPLRSIETLHVEILQAGDKLASFIPPVSSPPPSQRSDINDGFQTQIGTPATASAAAATAPSAPKLSSDATDQTAGRNSVPTRRHQIPGLRRTPYLKLLLVRCDDNDSYKGHVRQEIRDWIKTNTPPSSKKVNTAENHDAFEWLIIHVVIPNTVAATQPRKSDSGSGTEKTSTTSRWRPGSSTLLEKLRSDFNSSSKGAPDRIAQIRIGVNDVPYDSLPRVVPAVPSGYTETEQETENAWTDLISKFRSLILSSFDQRVSQYEEDIREKDAQRSLPGWNFCTFFILKEGLARGFESVGLVEDALVGYDELSVGLDMVIKDQALGKSDSAASALLGYTEELKKIALKAAAAISGGTGEEEDELVDLQSSQASGAQPKDNYDDIPISSNKKPYRDMIVANNVSIFDFRCYIFARQIALLLRLGNAWSTREELLAILKEQQESVIHGVAPRAPPPKHKENENEDLSMLAEICRRALEFIPSVSQVMRKDILSALSENSTTSGQDDAANAKPDPIVAEVVDNLVASFAFSIAQQILAQTSTKALPIPPSTLVPPDGHEPKSSIPEPKTMMHPARSSSLQIRTGGGNVGRPLPSPNVFTMGRTDHETPSTFLKAGLEELAARRAELYVLSRNILEECGKKREWSDGWASVPIVGESTMVDMVEIDLSEDDNTKSQKEQEEQGQQGEVKPKDQEIVISTSGIESRLLKTALDNQEDFYRLYEILTDKALRHYTVANHTHSIQASMADLAVLKYHLGDYGSAASYFWRTTPFFGESGWSLLELSMLVMYSRCLKKLERKDEYVKVLLKLLSKAAAAERDRQQALPSFRSGAKPDVNYTENEVIKGFLHDLLGEVKTLPNELRVPLSSFFSCVEVDGPPEYYEGRDSICIRLKVRSLLVDDLNIERARVRIMNPLTRTPKEIWFEQTEPATLKPGNNKLKLTSNAAIPGSYEIDKIELTASNLCLHYERELVHPSNRNDILKSSIVPIYHRADTLDVRLYPSKHIQLDHNNTVDIELDSGWNEIETADIRVKAATGGLRLITSEATCIDSPVDFSKPPEGGLFCFESIPRESSVRIRFPYTVEQETLNVSVRIEVSYVTKHGNFTFSKTPTIHTALALGVNVQDVFKHDALFSRFTVSTASLSPLRLYKSELLGSDLFDSEFGVPSVDPVVIFPKQPASLLYKIKRRPNVKLNPKASKTMYLKLYYSVLQEEIETLVSDSIIQSLRDTPLRSLSRLLVSTILPYVRNELGAVELERAALLGFISTSFLTSIAWTRSFTGVGKGPDGAELSDTLASFLQTWQAENPKLVLANSKPAELTSILIPVDIPSVTIVHTADIRLQPPSSLPPTETLAFDTSSPSVYYTTHQLLPATLHLRWTRLWDTVTAPADQADLEFSYELTAPSDTWLLGGRRKGHFVIPAPSTADAETELCSSPETEADIPILLIPLREGWLPYPSVEIREVRPATATDGADMSGGIGLGGGTGPVAHFESDVRNMGETVRVVADRTRVTLSLDASGPGGGPLVLDVERRGHGGVEGRVVA